MLIRLKKLVALWAVIVIVAVGLPAPAARASLSSCTADTSPREMAPNATIDVSFTVQNTDVNPIRWMRVVVPSSDFTIVSTTISGWNDATSGGSTSTFLTGGTLNPGDTLNFTISTQAANTNDSPANWVYYASDDAGGNNSINCTGTQDLAIVGDVVQPLAVSNVQLSGLTATSVLVTWDTNAPATSQVDYGLDETYGTTKGPDAGLVTQHRMTLSGLTANTGYHYMVTSTRPSDSSTSSSPDGTFLTAAIVPPVIVQVPVAGGGGSSGGLTGANVPGAVVQTTPTESVPPTVSLTTDMTRPFKVVPKLAGVAADNVAVARVDYSTDGGKNWLPVDSVVQATTTTTTGTGKKKKSVTTTSPANVSFSFTPVILDDGNYTVMARATDSSGNVSVTPGAVLVLDQLPPRFGTSVVTIGPQMIEPGADGKLIVPAGLDYKMTVSLVGGPTKVTVHAQVGTEMGHSFSLTPSSEPGLWVGILSFSAAGTYQLTGEAVDGAGNTGTRMLATVTAVPALKITGGAGALKGTKATLYNFSAESHAWQVWDAAAYGQHNPQNLNSQGALSLLVPSGEYYLKLESAGGPDTLTRSFTVDTPTPLTGAIALSNSAGFKLGPLSVFWPWTTLAAPPVKASSAASGLVENARLPLVKLPTTDGQLISPVDWYGKPTVLAAVATWAPTTAEQLPALAKLSANSDVNVVILAEQQRAETVAAYLQVADSTLSAVCDPDGLLSGTLTTPGVPALYFIDRHGIIKKVMVGTRSAEEILAELSLL